MGSTLMCCTEDSKYTLKEQHLSWIRGAKNKLQFLFSCERVSKKVDFSSYSYIYVRRFLTNPLFFENAQDENVQPKAKSSWKFHYPYRHTFKNESIVKRIGLD
jgi:hypothetical protein